MLILKSFFSKSAEQKRKQILKEVVRNYPVEFAKQSYITLLVACLFTFGLTIFGTILTIKFPVLSFLSFVMNFNLFFNPSFGNMTLHRMSFF